MKRFLQCLTGTKLVSRKSLRIELVCVVVIDIIRRFAVDVTLVSKQFSYGLL